MDDGYILLHRQITDNELWDDKPYTRGQAWVDLIMKANYKERRRIIKGNKVVIGRGQVLRSIKSLAEDWGWSPNRVRRFLAYLTEEQMIHTDGRASGTLITIEKYEDFQDPRRANGRANETADGRADERADGRRKKERKESNTRKEERGADAPTLADVQSYVKEKSLQMDPDAFYWFYQGTGWKKSNGMQITDWRAEVELWATRERSYQNGGGQGSIPSGPPEPPKYKPFEPTPEVDAVPMTTEQRRRMMEVLRGRLKEAFE